MQKEKHLCLGYGGGGGGGGEIQLSHFENASLVRPVIMNVQTQFFFPKENNKAYLVIPFCHSTIANRSRKALVTVVSH